MDTESDSRPGSPEAGIRPLTDELRQLAAEARALAEAEAAYQKSRAAFAGSTIPYVVALAVFAAVLGFFALMALTLGAVLALTPAFGAWGATGAVVGALLLGAAICVALALARWKWMKGVLGIGAGSGETLP
jgi:uncharacterized RDD family membrane protein YckC